MQEQTKTVIIGAGPAGLTAAYELSKGGGAATVLESGPHCGGLARTEQYKGYRFDIGGHRFYTKVAAVEKLWHELLGDDFLLRPRLSRIYYDGRFFKYPLEPMDAVLGLGAWQATACLLSFAWAQVFPMRPERTLDAWISNRFGRRLFETFFKSYTEKVWGMSCHEIDADWASQRIRGLDIVSLMKHMLLPRREGNGSVPKTLIDAFHYPRLGPGMMWEACAARIREMGGLVKHGARVERIRWETGRVIGLETADGRVFEGANFISTMAIKELMEAFDPAPPVEVLEAARGLRYRDFMTVALILKQPEVFPDNWIYIHSPAVKVGRIQNFKNWSAEMVPATDSTCLGMEYFCNEGDELWSMSDAELIGLGTRELRQLGIGGTGAVADGVVLRDRKAYPVYDDSYKRHLVVIREFLEQVPNLQLVGRNGMHHYNNQDHSMLTGMMAARNILGASYDTWKVNTDAEYLESGAILTDDELHGLVSSQPRVPAGAQRAAAS
jgi:protoporphyrinogen oxidase